MKAGCIAMTQRPSDRVPNGSMLALLDPRRPDRANPPTNATETYGMIQTAFRPSCMNRASVFEGHKRFKECRKSVRDDERCERSKKVDNQSWLAKGLGLRLQLLCWGFKAVQEDIPPEEASTLQIGSVAFPLGQCTSPQLHPCHRLFDLDGHQDISSPSL